MASTIEDGRKKRVVSGGLRASSSIARDVWHADAEASAYEWWYFDAVSDDGRDALVVIFLANFFFSPRYNRAASAAHDGVEVGDASRFPAVAFCLYRDGRPLIRSINEYAHGDFDAGKRSPSCRIGRSGFCLETKNGVNRYVLTLDETLRGRKRLAARFTWEVVEGGFDDAVDANEAAGKATHDWNMVAPRCRVEGAFSTNVRGGDGGRNGDARLFRGTGYHDHNRDNRWPPATIDAWQWGRAHFAGATVIFYRYREHGDAETTSRLFVVRDKVLSAYDADCMTSAWRRDIFGLKYARQLSFTATGEGRRIALHVTQRRVVDGSFFYLRFIGEAALDLGDGRQRHAHALTEHLAPRSLRLRGLDWLTDMRIGRNGKPAFLK